MNAVVEWPSPTSVGGITGTIHITQKHPESPVWFTVRLQGLPPRTLHGLHIHTGQIDPSKNLEGACAACGGHYNPGSSHTHGSIFNTDPTRRHAGDLINNVCADAHGRVRVTFADTLLTVAEIVGRSIVLHADADDLGRQGGTEDLPFLYGRSQRHTGGGTFTPYPDQRTRTESLKTGCAGNRIACGNIAYM
jgi:Cu-Zn family superoxide dismutase